jgi:cation/acetate symporter
VVSLAYLIPQMTAGAVLFRLLLGVPYHAALVAVGVGMIVYVMLGGMVATTWIQIVKAVLLLGTAVLLTVLILLHFGFRPLSIFTAVEAKYGARTLAPGNYLLHPLDSLSLGLSFAFGTAGLPHVMTRFYTVPDARAARKSVIWLMFLAGSVFFVTTPIGFAAAALVGQHAIRAADPGGNLALPLLAQYLGGGPDSIGGQLLLAFVAAVAFATILAVAAGLTLSTASAHDLYVSVIKRGDVPERQQV